MRINCQPSVRHAVLLFLIFFSTNKVFSANYYWVGGTGTWNQLTHWASTSGGAGSAYASQPGSGDNVFFTPLSGITPASIITLTPAATSTCKNLSFATGVSGYKIAGLATARFDLNGNLTLESGMVFTWLGSLWFYQDNAGLVNTITTANVPITARDIHFETPSSGTGGNFVVNGIFSVSQNPVTVDINLQSATNSVLFNQRALLGYTQTLHKGILITPVGFDCVQGSTTTSRFEVHSEGTIRNDGDVNFNHLYNYGKVYLNYSNTATGNTITSKIVTVSGSNSYTIVPPIGFAFMLDFTNCHFFVKQYWNYGSINGASVPNPVNIVATGSTIQFTSTATSMTWLNHTFHNIIVDENLLADFGFTHSIENYTNHAVNVDSLTVNRTTNFITPSNQYHLDLRIHNLLKFTAGHLYTGNNTYHTFKMLAGSKIDMQGTCDQPIWLQGSVFDVAGAPTVVTNNLIFRGTNTSAPGTISAGAGSRTEAGSTATGWSFGGASTARTLVWVGQIPTNISNETTYGNWYNNQNWCDVTAMPGGAWMADVLNAPGNPGHCGSVCPPTEIDSVIFPNNSYVFCDKSIMYTEGMNWLGTGRIYGTSAQDIEVWGSLRLSPQMINDFGGTFRFRSNRTYRCSITTSNQPFDYGTLFNSQNGLGSWLLMDTLKVPILDPEVTSALFNNFSVGIYSGHLYTGTTNCTAGNGQTIVALGLVMAGGELSLFDSDVYIQNAVGTIVGSSDINFRGSLYIYGGILHSGTSNFILERIAGFSSTATMNALVTSNYVLYDVTFKNSDPIVASQATHCLRMKSGVRVHNLFADNNTFPVVNSSSTSAATAPRIQKAYGNANYKFIACADNSNPLFTTPASYDNTKFLAIDTLQFAKGVEFRLKTTILSLLQMYPSGVYSLGDLTNPIQVIFSPSTSTVSPFQCGVGSIAYPLGGKLVANGNCALGSAYINFGEFISNSTATHIADFANVNNNIVTGSNSPINTTNGLFVGVTTGWAGVSASARKLHWVDVSGVSGNVGNFQDPNHWEQLLPFYAAAPQCPPVLVDTVLFDNTSFSATNQTVELLGVTDVASMYWKNIALGTNPTMLGANLQQLRLRGNLELHANMINNHMGTVLFSGVPTTQFPVFTIKTGSVHLRNDLTFLGDNDLTEWHLLDSLYQEEYNPSYTRTYVTRGRLFTDGYNMNLPSLHSLGTFLRYMDITNSFITLRSSSAGNSGVWNYDWKIDGTVVNGKVQNFNIKTDNSTLFSPIYPGPYVNGQNPRDMYELGGCRYNNIISANSKIMNIGPNAFRRDTINSLLKYGGISPVSVNNFIIAVDSIVIKKAIFYDPVTIDSDGGTYDSLILYKDATFTTSNRYNNLLHFEPAKNYFLTQNTVQWIKNNGVLDLNGGSTLTPIQFYGTPTGSQAYIRKDTTLICADFVNIRDVWAIGNGNNPINSCSSYGNSPVNNNTAHPNPWINSMADTITDITSSCGPWYGPTPSTYNRGRADFNAGSNADLQGNAWGWGKRPLPPLPLISLTDYTTIESCQGDTLLYGIDVVGELPITIKDNWIINGDTIHNSIIITDASDFASGNGTNGNPYHYIDTLVVPPYADTIVVTNVELYAYRCANNYAENLQKWTIIINPTPFDLVINLSPASNSVCLGTNVTISGTSAIANITYTLTTTTPTFIDDHQDGGSVQTGAIISDTSFIFNAVTSKGCKVDSLLKFFIGDITPPTLVCVDDTLIAPATACSYTLQDFTNYPTFSVLDDCTDEAGIIVTQSPLPGIIYNPGDIVTVTMYAEDEVGNIDSCKFVITVSDTTAPTIVCGVDSSMIVNVSCGYQVPDLTAYYTALSDNCTATASIVVTQSIPSGTDTSGITVVYIIATDQYGNSDSCGVTLNPIDTIAPVLIGPFPADTTMNCDQTIPVALTMTATDNCGTPVVTVVEVIIPGLCANSDTIKRTYTATDGAGNTNVYVHTIVVQDTTKPVFDVATLPTDTTVNCDAVPAVLLSLTATDNCSAVGAIVISFNDASTQGATGTCAASNYIITRTYSAEDVCGNIQDYVQTITVQDTTKPVFDVATLPVDTIVNCDAVPAVLLSLAATDNCSAVGAIVITCNDATTQTATGCSASNYTITRTYSAEDVCGNIQDYVQTITVQDTTKPVFDVATLPVDTIVNCDAVPAVLLSLTATDNCSAVGAIVITCNDATTQTATGCSASNYTITRTYSAEDVCGNIQDYVQTITVQDTTKPVFDVATLPADTIVNCDAVPAVLLSLAATDNCSAVGAIVITSNDATTQTAIGCSASNYIITRTYSAEDVCGNIQDYVQTITVQDTTKPVFDVATLPADTTVNCDAVPAVLLSLTATDNCSAVGAIVISFNDASTQGAVGTCAASNYIITRTYSAEDVCGNIQDYVQTITVQDTTKPVFDVATLPNDTIVNCDAVPAVLTTLTVTDNCSAVGTIVITSNDATTQTATGCSASNYVITRTYSAEDVCGNIQDFVQTITVQDTTKPVFDIATLPTDTTVNCDAVPAVLLSLTATDNCSATADITITSNDASTQGAAGTCAASNYVITRTYSAEDVCGNIQDFVQTITVQDTTKPTFTCLSNQIVSTNADCEFVIPDYTVQITDAADNCSGTVTLSQSPLATTVVTGNTTVTLTATDACGNATSCSFVLTVEDLVAPTPVCQNITVYLDETGNISIDSSDINNGSTDNCSIESITLSQYDFDCSDIGTPITVTMTVTDFNGNFASCDATVTVEDSLAPVVACQSITIQLDASGNASIVAADIDNGSTDNCDIAPTMTLSQSSFDCSNLGANNVTLYVEDVYGNIDSCVAVVTVEDNILPTLTCNADTVVNPNAANCGALVSLPNIVTDDNCLAETLTWIMSGATTDASASTGINNIGSHTFGLGTTTVEYTVSDASGNEATCSFTVNVTDSEAPIILGVPSDTTLNNDLGICGAVVTWNITTIDNCGTPTLTSSHVSGSVFPVGQTTVSITSTDGAGNATTGSFIVTVIDAEFPIISGIPSPGQVTFCADEPVNWNMPVATDNCAVVSFSSDYQSGDNFPIGTTTVTYTAVDAAGNTTIESFVVTVNPLPTVDVASSQIEGCSADNVVLEVLNPNAAYSYEWMYNNSTVLGTGPSYTLGSVSLSDGGYYQVTATNDFGCIAKTEIELIVKSCDITIFESFSPGKDGKNDYFHIDGLENFPNTKVIIFNRWGTEVFKTDDYKNDWDGISQSQYNVGGGELPEGTYFYLLELGGDPTEDTFGKVYKGYVYIKR